MNKIRTLNLERYFLECDKILKMKHEKQSKGSLLLQSIGIGFTISTILSILSNNI